MGTSRESSTMKSIIISIIRQLNSIFDDGKKINFALDASENIILLRNRLIEKLKEYSNKLENNAKITILLDSIDQLSKDDHNLEWMFYDLPQNVKIIYSVLSDAENLIERIKQNLEINDVNYLKTSEFQIDEANAMLTVLLKATDRTLNQNQLDVISDCWKRTCETGSGIQPLHIKLIFDISSKWTSQYTVPSCDFLKCTNTKETIKYLFKKHELLYGKLLFSRCIFYLTFFEHNGIGESELEDILSIDDDVLTSVFHHYHPPTRRFPLALWLNIKYELRDYITNKETDGMPVVSWYDLIIFMKLNNYLLMMFLFI